MGQANRRGSYEERKAQGVERTEAERTEHEKFMARAEQERMERVRANRLLQTNSGTGGRKGKARTIYPAAIMLAMTGEIGQI